MPSDDMPAGGLESPDQKKVTVIKRSQVVQQDNESKTKPGVTNITNIIYNFNLNQQTEAKRNAESRNVSKMNT
jgi:hypothetical protein